MPLMLSAFGLPLALWTSVTVAERPPVADGVKVSEIACEVPGVMVSGVAGAAIAKSAAFVPPRAIAEMTRSAVPVFWTVTVFAALVVPWSWSAKVTLAGVTLMVGATPVPVRGTLRGLPAVLSVIESDADLAPVVVGEKTTFTVVDPPGETVMGRVAALKLKAAASGPMMARLLMTRSAVPVFVKVIGLDELVVLIS